MDGMDARKDRAPAAAGDRPFGPDAATILATEHWSLLGTRSILWNERMTRTTVFLTVLSGTIIALALLADATGFGPQARALALVLLPIVFLLGLATYVRLVQINTDDLRLLLAMNRLRNAYMTIAPGLAPYFSTGYHDDERGIAATNMLSGPRDLHPWTHFLITTTTIVATIDAAIATAVAVLLAQQLAAPGRVVVVAGAVTFPAVWGALFSLHARNLTVLRPGSPRFPTPPDQP